MSKGFVPVVLICAYVPLGIMLLTYLLALFLRAAGKPAFLRWLVEKTSPRQPETPPGSVAADRTEGGVH
jgi:hypothetical protein